jgi:hypothetical protein
MPKPKNMREASIRNHYLTRLSELLRQLYIRRPSSSTPTHDVHQRLNGFIEAALISRTVSNVDIQAAVDQEHMKAYGLSVEERGQIQQQILAACEDHDWSSFDEPAVNRRKPKRAIQRGRLDRREKR